MLTLRERIDDCIEILIHHREHRIETDTLAILETCLAGAERRLERLEQAACHGSAKVIPITQGRRA